MGNILQASQQNLKVATHFHSACATGLHDVKLKIIWFKTKEERGIFSLGKLRHKRLSECTKVCFSWMQNRAVRHVYFQPACISPQHFLLFFFYFFLSSTKITFCQLFNQFSHDIQEIFIHRQLRNDSIWSTRHSKPNDLMKRNSWMISRR